MHNDPPNRPSVILRCDGGGAVGLGHVSRCTSLADALVSCGAQCAFVLGGPRPDDAAALPRAAGHEVTLAVGVGAGLDALPACDLLVVDTYEATGEDLERVSGARVCVLDDLGDRDLRVADLVLNPDPRAAEYTRTGHGTTLLCGPGFALIDPRFADIGEGRSPRPEVHRILVCLGGAATRELTATVCEQLARWSPRAEISVVGAASSVPQMACVSATGPLSRAQMAAAMVAADLAVATPSTIAWELCACRTPALFVQTVDNQARVARALRQRFDAVATADGLGDALERLGLDQSEARRALSDAMHALCDGRGARRAAEALVETLRSPSTVTRGERRS